MVTILSGGCRGKADNKSRLHRLHHLLKREGRKMTTLIDNHLAVFGNKIVDGILRSKTSNNSNIHTSSPI
jgi:hypothetical protein